MLDRVYQRTFVDTYSKLAFAKPHGEPLKALDALMTEQNGARTHQGRYCFVKTPMPTFLDARAVARDKQIGDQSSSNWRHETQPATSCRPSDQIETYTISEDMH